MFIRSLRLVRRSVSSWMGPPFCGNSGGYGLVRIRRVDSESPLVSDSPLSIYMVPDVNVLGLFSGGLAPLGPESTGL